jgi:hypothetical protein
MRDDSAMLAFAKLAEISQQKQQFPQRDKFLLLTAIAACHVGDLEIAGRCRDLVLANNSAHLIRRFDSIPVALRSSEFDSFRNQLQRFCSYEKAEHLLAQLGEPLPVDDDESQSRSVVSELLDSPLWNT